MLTSMTIWKRFTKLAISFFAIYLIAACAINTPAIGDNSLKISNKNDSNAIFSRQGRISLRVEADSSQAAQAAQAAQALYGAFVISGDAKTGELTLNSPLGNTVAKLVWTPQSAELTANSTTTQYPSTEALFIALTGTMLPLSALFDWLAGVNSPVEGWEVDASKVLDLENAKLSAKRTHPAPKVDLRIALEQP